MDEQLRFTIMFRSLLAFVLLIASPGIIHAEGDVLIVAPHPDDEVIGCAGVMMRALAAKKHVTVVILTNGDGYANLAAAVAKKTREQLQPDDFIRSGAVRQGHAVQATKRLGLPQENLLFLGYPDGGLEKMWQMNSSDVFRQMLTQKRETYGVTVRDYHSLVHDQPAAYTRANVVADLVEIIRAKKPDQVLVSHESDKHGDHRSAFWFAREALRESAFTGRFLSFVVHGEPLKREPDLRVTLSSREYEMKRDAIIDHTQGTSPVHDGLVKEYLKQEELFWAFPIREQR